MTDCKEAQLKQTYNSFSCRLSNMFMCRNVFSLNLKIINSGNLQVSSHDKHFRSAKYCRFPTPHSLFSLYPSLPPLHPSLSLPLSPSFYRHQVTSPVRCDASNVGVSIFLQQGRADLISQFPRYCQPTNTIRPSNFQLTTQRGERERGRRGKEREEERVESTASGVQNYEMRWRSNFFCFCFFFFFIALFLAMQQNFL